ncbi:protein kinase domain-containing protein [Zavarzinella formosa]|uniref:protein kinase domain-containing protein n=1 Tax=Zavarzinella formosa TaxID=360055 RepID=UPI0002FBC1C8|nr:protein kinase [Zavarzinella formosa]
MNSLTNLTDAPSDEPEVPLSKYFGPPKQPDELGTHGRYRVLKQLGMGGMGAVFLAFDESLDRKVALKVMLPNQAAQPLAKERFLREARAAARVKSDHVVTLHEVGEANGIPFIAMEFLEGQPLDEFLRHNNEPSLPLILRIGRETALGLADAHALGLVHRDIKPANLWVEAPKGRIKILDFGLARQQSKDAQLTQSGMVMGTPSFMSPEQAMGKPLDGRSDLFSLGGVLYRLCAGRLPFPGNNQMEVLTRLATEEPSPVRGLNPNIPEPLARIIHKLLAKNPANRFSSADEVVRAIMAVEAGGVGTGSSGTPSDPSGFGENVTLTRPIPSPAATAPQKRMSLALAALLGVGTVVMLASLAALYDQTRTRQKSAPEIEPPVQNTASATPVPAPTLTAFEILTSPAWTWSAPENLGPAVNTAKPEYSPVVTGDERRLVYSGMLNVPWMILEATRESPKQPFGNVTKVVAGGKLVSATQPWISDDGLTLLVVAQRPGGNDQDIWMCRRKSLTAPWDRLEQLSRNVNSDSSEESPAMSPDGRTLYFSSNRGSRNFHIWRCRRSSPEVEWGPAERLDLEINTESAQRCPRVLSDGKSITFTRRGDSEYHFWMAATPLPAGNWDVRIITKISPTGTHDPCFAADGKTVWCSGDGPGGAGGSDLWQMKRIPVQP